MVETRSAYKANVVEETVLDQRFRQTSVITSPVLGVAVAHSSEHPGNIHPSATAREHEVVIQFVVLGCGSVESGALDREHNGGIVRIHENVAAEAVYWVLPSYRKRLRTAVQA